MICLMIDGTTDEKIGEMRDVIEEIGEEIRWERIEENRL